jgi:hypothetical protein
MDVTLRSLKGSDRTHGTILHAKRIGIGQSLLIVDSANLDCSIPFKPGDELEVRIYGQATLVSLGSFAIQLAANTILRIRAEENITQINTGGSGTFDVKGVIAWIEYLP